MSTVDMRFKMILFFVRVLVDMSKKNALNYHFLRSNNSKKNQVTLYNFLYQNIARKM